MYNPGFCFPVYSKRILRRNVLLFLVVVMELLVASELPIVCTKLILSKGVFNLQEWERSRGGVEGCLDETDNEPQASISGGKLGLSP